MSEKFHIAHILVSYVGIDGVFASRTKEEAVKHINEVLGYIKDGASFEDMAKKSSDCPSGAMGGLLGEVKPGEMVPEFEKVVFSLSVDEVSDVFESEFGYHIAKRYSV